MEKVHTSKEQEQWNAAGSNRILLDNVGASSFQLAEGKKFQICLLK